MGKEDLVVLKRENLELKKELAFMAAELMVTMLDLEEERERGTQQKRLIKGLLEENGIVEVKRLSNHVSIDEYFFTRAKNDEVHQEYLEDRTRRQRQLLGEELINKLLNLKGGAIVMAEEHLETEAHLLSRKLSLIVDYAERTEKNEKTLIRKGEPNNEQGDFNW